MTKIKKTDIIFNNIFDHIQAVRREALKRNVKANTIVIDTGVAIVNNLLVPNKPMLFGMKVEYETKLAEDFGFNFALVNDTTPSELDLLRRENAELKETINKIKELLGNEEI